MYDDPLEQGDSLHEPKRELGGHVGCQAELVSGELSSVNQRYKSDSGSEDNESMRGTPGIFPMFRNKSLLIPY